MLVLMGRGGCFEISERLFILHWGRFSLGFRAGKSSLADLVNNLSSNCSNYFSDLTVLLSCHENVPTKAQSLFSWSVL